VEIVEIVENEVFFLPGEVCRPQPRFCAVEGVFARASHGLPGFISIAIGWEYKKKEEGGLRTGGEDGVIVRDMKPYATIILLFLFFFLLSMIRILSPHYIDYIIIFFRVNTTTPAIPKKKEKANDMMIFYLRYRDIISSISSKRMVFFDQYHARNDENFQYINILIH